MAFVREHPEMFRHLAHDGPSAAATLVESAMRGGAQRVEIGHIGAGYFVAADVDWLAGVAGRDPFTELVPFPELGANAIHPEVVVAAFSKVLVTTAGQERRMVVGEGIDFEETIGSSLTARVIVFDLVS